MPFNTEHWDSMRELEDTMQDLRDQAEEDGIELNEESVRTAMGFMSNLMPAQGEGSEPSRLLQHREEVVESNDEDEWRIPTLS